MTQSTYFIQVKNVLKVLQGYTKGIRFIALLTMLCNIGVGQVWGETFNESYAYADKGSTWNLTECTDKSSYWLVPSGNNPSVASIDGLFEGKTITSDVKITIKHATFGSGNNPSESTFKVYNSSSCSVVVESTKSGSLASSSNYANVIYTVAKKTAVASLTNDLAIKITKPGRQIRLQSITVEFEYTTGGETPEPDPDPTPDPEPEPGTGGTGTINFNSNAVKINAASVTGDDNLGNTWTITTVGTTSYTASNTYYQVGSSSKPATSITFTTTLPSEGNITAFSAKFGGFSGTAGSVTLKVDDTSVGTGSLNAANDVTVSNSSQATGKKLTVTVTGIAKGVKVYYISYTYTTSSGGSEPETPATELTNDQFAWSAATAEATMGASNTFPTLTNTLPVSVTYESSNTSTATIAADGTITLVAPGTTTISAKFAGGEIGGITYAAKTVTYALTVLKAPATPTENVYVKVTETAGITDGEYLIVYEDGKVAFNGALETLDVASNTVEVTISDNVVAGNTEIDAATFTIDAANGTILSASGKYIGGKTSADNGINVSVSALVNSLSIDGEGNAVIISNEKGLRYNKTAGQTRFRFFKDNGGTQEKIALYKKASKHTVTLADCTNGSVSAKMGETALATNDQVLSGIQITLNNTPASGYKLSAYDVYKTGDTTTKVTVTDGKFIMPEFDVTISATFELAKTLTGIEITNAATQITFWQTETFNHDGLQVTAHFDGAEDEDVTTKATVTGSTATAGTQTVTVSYQEGEVTEDATYTITVKAIPNTKETAYTVADAYDIIDKLTTAEDVFISGIISQVDSYNSTYKSITYWISDDGTTTKQLQVYGGFGLDEAKFDDINGVSKADKVIVYGNLKKYYGTYEFDKNNYLVEHTKTTKADPELSYTTTEYNVNIGEPFTAPTLNNPHSLAVTYSSSNEDVATVAADGAVTIKAAGTVTITASFEGNEDYIAGETSYTITITNPPHTITWNVGGETFTTTVVDGAAVELPENPSSCSDKYTTFVGWYTEASGMESTPSATPQGEKVTASTVPTDNDTYYAVWADAGDATNVVDVLNRELIEITGTNYTDWSDKKSNSSAVFAGNSSGGGNDKDYIQLRSDKSTSGIITTTSGGKATKVVVTWDESTSNGRTLDIYGKNSAYTEATDLYNNNNKGTKLGSIVKGTSTELTISGDYEYIGLRSNSGAMYIDEIRITWSASSNPTGYISSCCQSPAVVSVTPANANLELNIDGTASTTVNISQTGGGNGKYYEPTVSPADGASLDWTALGVTYKQTAYDIDFTATKAGTYTVTGNFTETAAGCSKTGSATISVAANPILLASASELTFSPTCGQNSTSQEVEINSRYLTSNSITATVATTSGSGEFTISTDNTTFGTSNLTLSGGTTTKVTDQIYVRYEAEEGETGVVAGTLTLQCGSTQKVINLTGTCTCSANVTIIGGPIQITAATDIWVEAATELTVTGTFLTTNADNANVSIRAYTNNAAFQIKKGGVTGEGAPKTASDKALTLNTDGAISTADWTGNIGIVYKPAQANTTETATLTVEVYRHNGTTIYSTATYELEGRSLPEQFVIAVTNGSGDWFAVPADMVAPWGNACSGLGTFAPYPISVDNTTAPTIASDVPVRAVYQAAARTGNVNTNPQTMSYKSVPLGGNYYLYGSSTSVDSDGSNTNIQNASFAESEKQKWFLDVVDWNTKQYNMHLHGDLTTNVLAYTTAGGANRVGQYSATAATTKKSIYLLPINGTTCTYYAAPVVTVTAIDATNATIQFKNDRTTAYEISLDQNTWTDLPVTLIKDCNNSEEATLLQAQLPLAAYRGKTVYIRAKVTTGTACQETGSFVVPNPTIDRGETPWEYTGTAGQAFSNNSKSITISDLWNPLSVSVVQQTTNSNIQASITPEGVVTVSMAAEDATEGVHQAVLQFISDGASFVDDAQYVGVQITLHSLAVQEFDGGSYAFTTTTPKVLCENLVDENTPGWKPEIYLSYPLYKDGDAISSTSELNETEFTLIDINTGSELSFSREGSDGGIAKITLNETYRSSMIPGHTYRLSWENTNQVMTNAIGLPYMDCYMDFVYSENCDAPTALLACPITNSGFTANWVPKADCTDNVTVDVYTRGAETTLLEKTTFSTTEVKDLQYAGESNLSGNYWITNIEGTKGGAPSISSNRLLISDVSTPEYYNLFSPLLSNLGSINESIIYTITITLYQATSDAGAGADFYVMDNGSSLTKNTTPTITNKSVVIDGQTATNKKLTSGTTTFTVKGLSSDDRIRLLGFETSSIASKSKNVYISSIKIEASGSITPVATKTISCNAGSAEFTGLSANTQYYYTVTDGSSNTSNEIAVTTYSGEQSLVFYSDEACTETITETLVLGGEKTTIYVSGTYVPGCEINTAVSSGYGIDDSGLIYVPTTGSVTGSIVLTLSDVNTTEGTLTLTDGKGNAYVLNINSSNCPTGFGSMALAASNINKTTATANWNNALNFGSPKYGTLHLYKNGEVNVEKIVNGDFETGSLEQGWSNTIHTGEGYQDVDAFETYIVITNNDAHEGGSYLYVSVEGSGNKYDDFHDMPILYADYVDLLPGTYQMKAWAKMKPAKGYNDKQQKFALGLISGDKNSRAVVCKSEVMSVMSNNTYVELIYEFELLSTVRACPVIGVKRDAGDFIPFYIDDVSLKRIKCPERGDEVKTIDIADLSAESSLDLTDLTPATEYTYVIQNAADCSSNEITFATDYSAIVQVHFSEDGTITSVPVDAETHKVTFEPTQSCAGRIFVGWSRDLVALTQTEPVGLVDLENETFTETTLLYAIYKSANGGKGNGISQVAFTEQFTGLAKYDTQNQNTVKTVQTQYTEWEYCYGRTRESGNANSLLGHVDLMFYGKSSTYKYTQAYLRTTQKIEGLSQLSLYARVNSNIGNTFHVQVSEDGTRWTDVADRIMPGNNYTQYIITLPTPVDAYIRIITTSVTQFASDATLNIDDIEIQTQARQFFYSDYATTCEGASSVAMTFDLNGGTAPTGKESDYETKTTANTWHTLPAAPKKGNVPFLGWKVIDVPGYEMTFDAGEKYLLNHNVTLQAQWPTTEGDLMDIVDWNTNSITINMNGYTITPEIQYYLQGNDASSVTLRPTAQNTRYSFSNTEDRTYDIDISSLSLTPGESLQLSVTMGADFSNQYYRVPYIYNASQTLPNTLTADDDIVVRDGCLTVEGAVQVNTIYVYPTAELRIAEGATLTANKIYMRTNAFQSAVLTDNGTLNVGQLYYTRIVADKQNSFLMALPFQSAIADMRLTTGETKTYNKQWVLYTYDAAQRAQTGATGNNWVKQSSITSIQPYTSYELLSGSAYYREYCFPVAYTKTNANVDISVTAHTGAAAQADPIHGGWNAIASPYTQNIQPQWGAPEEAIKLTRLLDDNKTYYQYVPTIIEPATAFYYQTAQTANLQFTTTTLTLQTPQAVAAKAAQREETDYPTQWINIVLSKQNDCQDQTNIYIHPDKFVTDYETSYDLTKMMGYGNRAQCYTTMPCGKLSFNALPLPVATNGINMGIYAPQTETLTLSITPNNYIQNVEQILLQDHYTNQTTDLLHTSYSFVAQPGEDEERFTIFIKCSATAITTDNAVQHNSQAYAYTQPKKLFLANLPRSGNIVIYDAVGKQIVQQRITQTNMDFVLPTGNYYVKVVNESEVQIIPTIVK